MAAPVGVVHRERQPLGWRGWVLGTAINVTVVVGAVLVTGDLTAGVTIALGFMAIRQGVITGPHCRTLVVTETETRAWRARLPHADLRRVEVLDAATMRAAVKRSDEDIVHTHAGVREGVRLQLRSPEGIERFVLLGSRDPQRLVAAIEPYRGTQRRPAHSIEPVSPPVRTRQGVDRRRAGVVLGIAVAMDAVSIFNGLVPIVTPVVGLAMLFTALRRVEVDDRRVRVGTLTVPFHEIESIRTASTGEGSGKMYGRTRAPIWGPRYVLLVVRRSSRRPLSERRKVSGRTDVLGVPRPIDVPELAPPTDPPDPEHEAAREA